MLVIPEPQEIDLRGKLRGSKCDEYCIKELFSFDNRVHSPIFLLFIKIYFLLTFLFLYHTKNNMLI